MKIKLNSNCLVKPGEPKWNGSLPLSELDQIGSIGYVNFILLYRPPQEWLTPPEAIAENLKSSLSKLLISFHPLAGRLTRIPGGRLQIQCNGIGVPLTDAESEATLDELKEFEQRQLVPSIDLEQLPLVAVQLTRFNCGGVCVGVAMSHAAMDGLSSSHFYSEWARLARGKPLETQPFLNREMLGDGGRQPCSAASPPQQPPEFDAPPLLISRNVEQESKENPGCGGSSFTRFEAMTAHIWRCACKSRRHTPEQRTRLSISVDIRRRVQAPLPKSYLGNAVLDVVALDNAGVLVSKSLSYAAGRIRETINKVTNDWLGLQFHGIDIGWGKEIYMGPADYGSDGDCMISSSSDGSVAVIVCLQEAHMEVFKKLFYEDMEFLVHESCCLNSDGSHHMIEHQVELSDESDEK
ncbi:UNVERIFIED_CONTAM: Spermidine hydroxycinnamoyl transferase [Sesamum latifolium]|uniref:Spermidine hydroxycinnamoyl transferase n=1 Tax=Sesamum latifolium TaxID=2727402 RepID=A0AAW2XR41_9LAMI